VELATIQVMTKFNCNVEPPLCAHKTLNIIHTTGLYTPPVDKYLKACMFQHAALGFAMDSWCVSGTLPLAF